MADSAFPVGYVLAGLAMVAATVLPRLLRRSAGSPALVFVAAGVLAGLLPGGGSLDPAEHPLVVEHATELCVIVSLMGVGLALDRPLTWRGWGSTWRLLGIAMPVSIGLAALGGWALGLAPATALLLGAVLAPTDPVLASDVQVGEPTSDPGSEDEIRFALTSEAGLNDGLAFPFVHAALLLVAAGSLAWVPGWAAWQLVGKVLLGVAVGVAVGRLFARLAFAAPIDELRFAETADAVVVLAAVFLSYGVAELVGGYGFLAVFAAGMALRGWARDHDFHRTSHVFITRFERMLTMGLLVLLGYAVGDGLLAGLTWPMAMFAVLSVLLLRPLAGGLAMLGAPVPATDRRAIATFGVKGIGSFYYLAYALGQAQFPNSEVLWPTVTLAVLTSVVVHGLSATPVLRRIDQRMGRRTPEPV
ncbi:MAG TPA: cation:proton antiporter [Candidatus Nanopelagicales bacterium]